MAMNFATVPLPRTRALLSHLLSRICDGPLLSADHLRANGAFEATVTGRSRGTDERQGNLIDNADG